MSDGHSDFFVYICDYTVYYFIIYEIDLYFS